MIAVASVALAATLAAACTRETESTPGSTPSPVPVKVAFFQDLTAPGASQVVTPSYLGLRLALSDAEDRQAIPVVPDVVPLDTEGDATRAVELAREVAADPSYVAAVIGPFWAEPVEVGNMLDAAGIPTLSLSGSDPSLARQGWNSWRRLVAGTRRQVSSFGSALRASSHTAGGICVAGDDSAYSIRVSAMLGKELGGSRHVAISVSMTDDAAIGKLIEQIRAAGCGTIAWTGFVPGATLVRAALAAAKMEGIVFLGMDAMKSDAYLTTTDGAGEGTIVTCACVDLASSTATEAGRFIHDFQSEYGSPPGAYAAEGWDAGGMLVGAFATGAVDRSRVAQGLDADSGYRGLADTYRFASDGELDLASTAIHVFRAEGIRWVPVGVTAPQTELPVATPGYLSVAACRTGRPFAYQQAGQLRGFDVELAGRIAGRLGLTLSWSDRSCRSALDAIAAGTLDALVAPVDQIAQGTPATRIALSLHAGLVTTRAVAGGTRPLLGRLEPGDVVAVVDDRETRVWATTAIAATGAAVKLVKDPAAALRGLRTGSFAAVAEPVRDAWATVERRPALVVAQSVDIGAHDVIVAKGPDAVLVAAIDEALGRLMQSGRYTLLFAKYFPGVPVPPETGT